MNFATKIEFKLSKKRLSGRIVCSFTLSLKKKKKKLWSILAGGKKIVGDVPSLESSYLKNNETCGAWDTLLEMESILPSDLVSIDQINRFYTGSFLSKCNQTHWYDVVIFDCIWAKRLKDLQLRCCKWEILLIEIISSNLFVLSKSYFCLNVLRNILQENRNSFVLSSLFECLDT